MTLAKRLNAMEQRINALEDHLAAMGNAFEELADGIDRNYFGMTAEDEQPITTLDGERVESRERDQNESLG